MTISNKEKLKITFWVLLISMSLCSTHSCADDTEIFFARNVSATLNVLFRLDVSGSMPIKNNGDINAKSRIQKLREAVVEILLDDKIKNTRVGLFAFSDHLNMDIAIEDFQWG